MLNKPPEEAMQKIREWLEWRGANGKQANHVLLSREQGKALLQWITERDQEPPKPDGETKPIGKPVDGLDPALTLPAWPWT